LAPNLIEESVNHSRILGNSVKIVNKLQNKLKAKEELVMAEKFWNKETMHKFNDEDLEFPKFPLEIHQKIKDEDENYNINEMDTTHEIVRKTQKAIEILERRNERIKKDINSELIWPHFD
jgi:hypothetical protein